MTLPLLETKHLSKTFRRSGKQVKALSDVSVSLSPNETLGIVGESGSGKTTFGKLLMGLYPPSEGEILYKGNPIHASDRMKIQYIFQDPYSSLNPRMTIEEIIAEPLQIQQSLRKKNLRDKVDEALLHVGLNPDLKFRYPAEFSGGQRQRISIARALITNPECIICDEPTTALDVSIQAQILHLLMRIQKELGLSYIFISHNLAVVKYISHRIAVMHQGKIIEENTAEILFESPKEEYTKNLLQSVPKLPTRGGDIYVSGTV